MISLKKILVLVLVSMMLLSLSPTQGIVGQMEEQGQMQGNVMVLASYTPHAPFNITCNKDFIDQGWPGSGTTSDPYIISGLNITDENQAIWIFNTSAYVVIEDCYFRVTNTTKLIAIYLANASNIALRGSILTALGYNLVVQNMTNLEVKNCTLNGGLGTNAVFANVHNAMIEYNQFSPGYYDTNAVNFAGVENVTFQHNLIDGFQWSGIEWGYASSDCLAYNNTLIGSTTDPFLQAFYGIIIEGDSAVDIIDNRIQNASVGILLQNYSSTVELNTITYCTTGIVLQDSVGASVHNNFINCTFGIDLQSTVDCTIQLNTIRALHSGITLAQSLRANVNSNTISSRVNGIVLYNANNFGQDAPHLEFCDISNNYLSGGGFQFMVNDVSELNHKIRGNVLNGGAYGYFLSNESITIDGELFRSLTLVNVSDVTVKGGEFQNTTVGIEVLYSHDVTITDAIVHNTTYGISLKESLECDITNNHLYYNGMPLKWQHLYIQMGAAISIENSRNGTMNNNDIHDNYDGIALASTNNFLITYNLIYNNSNYGISLDGLCSNNRIYQNQIGWNGINAKAQAASNYWDDGVSMGNYWSDYDGSGEYEVLPNGLDHYPKLLTHLMPFMTEGIPLDATIILIGGVAIGVIAVAIIFLKKR